MSGEYAPTAPRPPAWSRLVPSVGIGLTLLALVAASSVAGLGGSVLPGGVDGWLPPDGHRVRFGQRANSAVRFAEWSRPDVLSLMSSDLVLFEQWRQRADETWLTSSYLRMRRIEAGADGVGISLSDGLWTVDSDGARLGIDSNFPGEVALYLPGRLDLPTDVAAGDEWVSEGTAHTWDEAAGKLVEAAYRASYAATAAADPARAGQGCLDVMMSLAAGAVPRTEWRTWCPKEGIVSYTDATGTWSPVASGPAVTAGDDEPFDWASADRLEFTARAVNDPTSPEAISMNPISPPGLLEGGMVVAEQLPPGLRGIAATDPLELAWAARPGGTPTASATLGGLTLVATTNRQVVAYNNQGRWLWQARLSDLAVATPVRFGDSAVLATLDGAVTALDLASGAVRWQVDLGAEFRSPPVVAGDRLVVANQAGALACLSQGGDLVWVIDAGVPRSIAVSAGPEPVVAYGESGSVVVRAYSLADGSQLWRHRVYQDARELIGLDQVVVLRDNDAVIGLDWLSGAVVWQWSESHTFAALGGDRRVLLLAETELILLSQDGERLRSWPHHLGSLSNTTPFLVASGETVLAYSSAGMDVGARP